MVQLKRSFQEICQITGKTKSFFALEILKNFSYYRIVLKKLKLLVKIDKIRYMYQIRSSIGDGERSKVGGRIGLGRGRIDEVEAENGRWE